MSLDIAGTYSSGTGAATTSQYSSVSMWPSSWYSMGIIFSAYFTSFNANSYALTIRSISSGDRVLFRPETSGDMKFRVEGSFNENTGLSLNETGKWITLGCSLNSSTSRDFYVVEPDGTVTSTSKTTSLTMSGAPEDIIYANQNSDTLLGEVYLVNGSISEHHVKAVARGESVFNMPDIGRRVVHYKSLRQSYNETAT